MNIEELKSKNSLLRQNLDVSIQKNDEMSEQLLRMEGMSSTEEFLKRKVSDLQQSLEASMEKYEHDMNEKSYELAEKTERLKRGKISCLMNQYLFTHPFCIFI